ncbi:MAG TPA: hypothetical protein VFI70_06130 [Nitrososphaeraceae archaeon]|nr:hypothetical protein [Nitrososphaeraceae archaeon]
MFKQDMLEPLVIKEHIIKSATEAANMLLRIDDVIAPSPCLLKGDGWYEYGVDYA